MRKIGLFAFLLIVFLLAVSCKQEIDCKLNIPSWAHGSWEINGEKDSHPVKGNCKISSDDIYETTIPEIGYAKTVDWKEGLESVKDELLDFSQSSSSSEYSFTFTVKIEGQKYKYVYKLTKNGSYINFAELIYVDGELASAIQGKLSPL